MGMIFALLPFGTAAYAQDTPISTADVCPPPGETASNEFPDDNGSVHESNINCVAQYEIAQGFVDGTYRPSENISRGQMATFIANMVETALGKTLPAGSDAFDDDDGTTHETNINKVANAGIVSGRGGGNYDPGGFVDRAAMATFIAQAIDYADDEDVNGSEPPAATEDEFPDDELSVHEDNINRLANQDIVIGKEDGLFHPNELTSRAQMATFIMQGAAYLDTIGAWAPTAAEAPTTNQTFTVTPSDKAVNQVSSSGTNNTGARTYSVSDLDSSATFDIELHEAEDVNVGADGTVTFDNNAPIADNTGVSIESVNGAVITAADTNAGETEVHNVSPINGQITFTIDSVVADRVIPVLNGDTDGDNTLDLASGTAPTAPTEPFGIGGEKEWVPAEAASGQPTAAEGDFDVTRVDTERDFFVAEDDAGAAVGTAVTFNYDSNDVFQIATDQADGDDVGATCVQVSMTQFEANLSVGDELDVSSSYNADPAFTSTFCLEDLTPGSPTAVSATASGNDVTVTWAAPASGADSYRIYRATDAENDGCPETGGSEDANYAQVGTSTSTSFTESNVANGNYCYTVTAVLDGDESAVAVGADDEDDVDTPVADVGAPFVITEGAVVDVDTGFNDVADNGDVLKLYFSEAVQVASDAAIIVEDTSTPPDQGTIRNGENSTWAVDGSIVTITLTATITTGGATPANVNWPATITNRSGVTDSAGNAWSLTSSLDLTLEDNGPEIMTDTADIGDTSFTVTFNEALNATSAQNPANYTTSCAGNVVTATLGADGRTVTLTHDTPLASGCTLTYTVTDSDGQTTTGGTHALT